MAHSHSACFAGLVCSLVVSAACGGGPAAPDPDADPVPTSLTVASSAIAAVPNSTREVRARVLDARGRGIAGVPVSFEIPPGHGNLDFDRTSVVETDSLGRATTYWLLPATPGQFALTARAERAGVPLSGSPFPVSATVETFAPAIDATLSTVEQYITWSLERNRSALGGNQQQRTFLETKIQLLERADVASLIVAGRLFSSRTVRSVDAREIDVVSVFPLDSLRGGAEQAATSLGPALAALEAFMGVAAPFERIQLWWGFAIGAAGGGGNLHMEDRGTYLARTALVSSPLPFDAILFHELAHSYIGHESLTQFLELLVYNLLRSGSTDVASWNHTRGYPGPSPGNSDVHALLEIRGLIGHEAMARAYRAIYDQRPPYGVLLSAAARQAFVDEAPVDLKSQVAAKADQIGY